MLLKQLLYKTAYSFGIILIMTGCQKNSAPTPTGVTALNLINATVNSSGIITNINNQLPYYLGQPSVVYGSNLLYAFAFGNTSLVLRQPTDTLTNLFTATLSLPFNTVHSLFMTGTVDAPDSLFVEDNLPCHCNAGHAVDDSTTGIRIINLSPGSVPVKVIITGGHVNSEIDNLGYKTITEFMNYAATSDVSAYNFQFNDAATGDSITSYILSGVNYGTNGDQNTNYVRFKNMTIVFYGLPGSQSTFLVNNF